MRLLICLPFAVFCFNSVSAFAQADCHELPRSGELVTGVADNRTFLAGAETEAGLCAIFPINGESPHFMEKGSYRLLPGSRVVDWRGAWSQGPHAKITIDLDADGMVLEGEAAYGLDRSVPAVGGFAVSVPKPDEWDAEITFSVVDDMAVALEVAEAFDCVLRLRRAGSWLVVNDNGRCGGAGVSFSGIYERPLSR